MLTRPAISLWHHVRYLPLWSALTVYRWRRFERRSRGLGRVFGFVLRWVPLTRRGVEREMRHIFPDMPRSVRTRLSGDMGRQMGQTLFEIYHCAEFQSFQNGFRASGPGLDVLHKARAEGKGAIIVSGHFGQWEAVRAVLKARGMETGAVYRPQKNRHYQRRLLAGIEAGGAPILPTGQGGTRAMVRHVRQGGFVAILLDEKSADGVELPFLGKPALTSLAAAQLALKYDLPMVPAFGTRVGDNVDFDVEFEEPIAHSDAVTMTQKFNDILSARILKHPDQWYWMLRRWKGAGKS